MRTPPATRPAHRNPDLAVPQPTDRCHVCLRPRTEIPGELSRLFRKWMCQDRVDCFRHWRLPA